MHHFIYPSKDTYITNRSDYEDKNFGIDEILQIGTLNKSIEYLSSTKDYEYTDELFVSYNATSFSGSFIGSFGGTVVYLSGNISGSGLEFSVDYFSGSVNGISQIGSGSVSGSLVTGFMTGSGVFPYQTSIFNGSLSGADVCMTGTGSGTDTRNEQVYTSGAIKFIDRALIAFDLTSISSSIENGTITNPKFSLKMKVCNEYDLPITYTIYGLPINQTWNMGDGYNSDNGGSDTGVSWTYRDNNYGTLWYSPVTTGLRPAIDFITNPSLAHESFAYGGGTWSTSSVASQSFQYESSDINMDVTDIVMSWISGSIVNNGLLLIHSDELQSTGSGFVLTYFSKDTNTIYSPYLDVKWDDSVSITGSISTSSIQISTINAGISSSVQSGSTFTIIGGISGSFSASTVLTITNNYSASILLATLSGSGIVVGTGLSGNITGLPVIGFISASIPITQSIVTGPCGKSFTSSFASGSFYDGIFSGSTFTAYYIDYKFENAILTGSWTDAALLGSHVYIAIPSGIEPYAYATVIGTYINGKALGIYTVSGSTSASFNGQFIDGNLLGGVLSLQLSGSVYTSSFSYTSSIETTSSNLTALDAGRPFTIALQGMKPTYKAGDIAKIGVFGRKQYPLKQFGKVTQQVQYMVPEYLPTSSFFALKDNQTEEMVLNFDEYTKISCEYPYGNYFIIDTTSLPQERYYRVLVQVQDAGETYTMDTGKTFKVTR